MSWSSLPVTGRPREAMIRAMAESAGAADADEVHPAEPGRRAAARRGPGTSCGDPPASRRPTSSTMRASCSSASRGISAGGRRPHRRQPAAVGQQRRHVAATQAEVRAASCDQQRAAGLDDRARVVLLLAVADRQRHEDRREADRRGLGDAVGAAARQHQVGGGVGEVHPVDEGQHDVA